ncbi:hypothetical protein INR49_018809 [Caranx melampygus]|nr:hypothetical protein INR49_018809 [Caranx melampygus]
MHQSGLSSTDSSSAYGLASNRHGFSSYSDTFMSSTARATTSTLSATDSLLSGIAASALIPSAVSACSSSSVLRCEVHRRVLNADSEVMSILSNPSGVSSQPQHDFSISPLHNALDSSPSNTISASCSHRSAEASIKTVDSLPSSQSYCPPTYSTTSYSMDSAVAAAGYQYSHCCGLPGEECQPVQSAPVFDAIPDRHSVFGPELISGNAPTPTYPIHHHHLCEFCQTVQCLYKPVHG